VAAPRHAQEIEDAHLRAASRAKIGVEQKQIEPLRSDPGEPGGGIGGDAHLVAIGREDVPKAFPSVKTLLDDKDSQ